jgi:hypothetical protein
MQTRRFFISWILASVVMFILSYTWHGIILNDFARLNYPKTIFLCFTAFAYIVVGLVVVKMVDMEFFKAFFRHRQLLKGIVMGMFCGAVFFLIATVIGVRFNSGSVVKNLVFDLVWQMIEQGIGGGVVALVHVFTRIY